jgi:hypothetical protein
MKTSAFIWWHSFVWSYDNTVAMKRFISLPIHVLIFSYCVVLRRAVVKWSSYLWLYMITNMSVSLIICITLKFLESCVWVCVCVCARVCTSVRACVLLFLPSNGLPAQQARFFLNVYPLLCALGSWSLKKPAKRLILSKSFLCLYLGGSHGRDFEKYCMLWCNSVEISFRRKPTAAVFRVQENTEQRGRRFLRNVEAFRSVCMASYPRRERACWSFI